MTKAQRKQRKTKQKRLMQKIAEKPTTKKVAEAKAVKPVTKAVKPATKKRGRPKKVAEAKAVKPATKKRGRPKKIAEKKPTTKKRGRPKKIAEKKPTTKKRSRGRPKKVIVPFASEKPEEKPAKKRGRPKKEIKAMSLPNSVVSLKKIAAIAGIHIAKLRKAVKRSNLDVVVVDKGLGVGADKIPLLIAEVKLHSKQRNAVGKKQAKLEKISKNEIWFEDLRKELGLTKKELETRCKHHGIETVKRYPGKPDFHAHFKRAIKKEDAEILRNIYALISDKEIKKIVKAAS